jgi:hypothetical protein
MKQSITPFVLLDLGMGAGSAAALPDFTLLYIFTRVFFSAKYEGRKLNIALCGLGRYAEILLED